MIKSQEELQLARHTGEVAAAMMGAGRDRIADGIPEFEVAFTTAHARNTQNGEDFSRVLRR